MQLRTADDIAAFIIADPRRRAILDAVRRQRLPDWAVGAGFIRSAVWDALHGYVPSGHAGKELAAALAASSRAWIRPAGIACRAPG
jgi:hypothetical protein